MTDYVHIPFVQDGTNTSSESPRLWLNEPNALDGEWGQSSYETDELFLQAITALRRAVQTASTVPVLADFLMSNREAPMTPDQVHALPYMQRLTLYFGLIVTIAEELRSIARIAPATAVTDSSREPESTSSSSPEERFPLVFNEPAVGSVVLDHAGDAWQRQWEGWTCAINGDDFTGWTWKQLREKYAVRLMLDAEED